MRSQLIVLLAIALFATYATCTSCNKDDVSERCNNLRTNTCLLRSLNDLRCINQQYLLENFPNVLDHTQSQRNSMLVKENMKRACHVHCENFVIGASSEPICKCGAQQHKLGFAKDRFQGQYFDQHKEAVITHHFRSPVTGNCLKAEELRFLPRNVRVPLFKSALLACREKGCTCVRVSTKDIRREAESTHTMLYQ